MILSKHHDRFCEKEMGREEASKLMISFRDNFKPGFIPY